MKTASLCFTAAVLLGLATLPSKGLIIYGPEVGGDKTNNLQPPASGAPWSNVGQARNGFGGRASSVYLGNLFCLTAQHVDGDISHIRFGETDVNVDTGFTPVVIRDATNQELDLRLFKLATDPGLPALPIIASNETDLKRTCTLIGWGAGKSVRLKVRGNNGWTWGDETTRAQRWGTNTTSSRYSIRNGRAFLSVSFNILKGYDEAGLALADSGSGLFIKQTTGWKLAGISVDVTNQGKTLFDNSRKDGYQGDYSYFVPLKPIRATITALTGTP